MVIAVGERWRISPPVPAAKRLWMRSKRRCRCVPRLSRPLRSATWPGTRLGFGRVGVLMPRPPWSPRTAQSRGTGL
eukprot:11424303-Alexandrium_andersonii.AAC.1